MKFSIRDLFLVTMIVAVCVAWWLDRQKLASSIKEGEEYTTKMITEYAVENAALKDEIEALKASLPPEPESPTSELPEGHLLGPPPPNSSTPAANPPKE